MFKKPDNLFLILTASVLLLYNSEGITGNYNVCISKAVTTADTLHCIAGEYKLVDKQLNESYTKLMKSLSPSGQKKLRYSERAWLKFRKEECAFSGHPMEYRTGEQTLIDGCYLAMTKERLANLNKELAFYAKYPTVR